MSRAHIVKIYLQYLLLAFCIIGSFFTLQILLVVKEFRPVFSITPGVIALMLGALLGTLALFKQRLVENHRQLERANSEVEHLHQRLHQENQRMGTELGITRNLQQMLQPKAHELEQIEDLDIACFMEPARDSGGAYYDVLQHEGHIKIGVGDVTGQGLEGSVLMLMVQMAVRTLLTSDVTDPVEFMRRLQRSVLQNLQRMGSDKDLSLALIDYQAGVLHLTGRHEEVLLLRHGGKVESVATPPLGFIDHLEAGLAGQMASSQLHLDSGDGIALYTAGLCQLGNAQGEAYGVERLRQVLSRHWELPAAALLKTVIADVRQHLGAQPPGHDITLLVCKQK